MLGGILLLVVSCVSNWKIGLAQSEDSEAYEFVPSDETPVYLRRGIKVSLGKLDASGSFTTGRTEQDMSLKQGFILHGRVLNLTPRKGVYEYRSGRLIKGDLDDNGNFVPELGSKIIDFKDYQYSPKSPVIYNLPGEFVKCRKATKIKP
jgi:hypothetical protein